MGAFAQFGDAVRSFHHRCGGDLDCLLSQGDVAWLAAGGGCRAGSAGSAGVIFVHSNRRAGEVRAEAGRRVLV